MKDPHSTAQESSYVVWRIVDGKAGHEAQTQGLLEALRERVTLRSCEIRASKRWKSFMDGTLEGFPPGENLPTPDLIIGAGSQTHLAILAARRAYGGKAIVLMQPSLPAWMFDLCLIPRHDRKHKGSSILTTDGVLNPMKRAKSAQVDQGLFLIGGPSKHYEWNTPQMLKQVMQLVEEGPEIDWTLTTSRRTPEACTAALLELSYPNLKVVPVDQTPQGWVAEQLERCGRVWVSEDSVSMVYESLTAGALTGLLEVPRTERRSRVRKATKLLRRQYRVVRFSDRQGLLGLQQNEPLAEAARCADYIVEQLLNA